MLWSLNYCNGIKEGRWCRGMREGCCFLCGQLETGSDNTATVTHLQLTEDLTLHSLYHTSCFSTLSVSRWAQLSLAPYLMVQCFFFFNSQCWTQLYRSISAHFCSDLFSGVLANWYRRVTQIKPWVKTSTSKKQELDPEKCIRRRNKMEIHTPKSWCWGTVIGVVMFQHKGLLQSAVRKKSVVLETKLFGLRISFSVSSLSLNGALSKFNLLTSPYRCRNIYSCLLTIHTPHVNFHLIHSQNEHAC